jgi:hypothetical protein
MFDLHNIFSKFKTIFSTEKPGLRKITLLPDKLESFSSILLGSVLLVVENNKY